MGGLARLPQRGHFSPQLLRRPGESHFLVQALKSEEPHVPQTELSSGD